MWLKRLIPVLMSQREEAKNLAAFHFCMEAEIKRSGQVSKAGELFAAIGATDHLRRVASSPSGNRNSHFDKYRSLSLKWQYIYSIYYLFQVLPPNTRLKLWSWSVSLSLTSLASKSPPGQSKTWLSGWNKSGSRSSQTHLKSRGWMETFCCNSTIKCWGTYKKMLGASVQLIFVKLNMNFFVSGKTSKCETVFWDGGSFESWHTWSVGLTTLVATHQGLTASFQR